MRNYRENRLTLLSAAAIGILSATQLVGSNKTPDSLSTQVDQLFARWDKPDAPGIAVGIVQNGVVIHSRGYGRANLDYDMPITSQTVFEIGSVTKSFTTASVALLLDDGDLNLNDNIRKYIPELPNFDPPIKVRHLLRCESGFRDYYISLQLAGWNVLDTWTKEDVLQLIAAQKHFDFQPGEQFAYSNSDFFLLGLIIERVTGKSLSEYSNERIFRPLAMEDTFFSDDASIVVKKRAAGYERKWKTGLYHRFEMRSGTTGPFGLKTTLKDMYRWDQNFYHNKLTAGRHFEEFLKTGCLIGNRNCLESFSESSYRGAKRFWYTGGVPGFMAQFIRFPKNNFSIILLCNLSDPAEWNAMTENTKRIADIYLADQLEPTHKKKPLPKPPVVNIPVAELHKFKGVYRQTNPANAGFLVEVSIQKEQIVITDHFGRETSLVSIGPTRFRPKGHASNKLFEFSTAGGKALSLTIQSAPDSIQSFQAFEVAKLTQKQIKAYIGTYYCDELLTTYFITVENNRLFLRVNNRHKEELAPTIAGEFVPESRPTTDEGRVYQFFRSEDGRTTNLSVRLWRGRAKFMKVSGHDHGLGGR